MNLTKVMKRNLSVTKHDRKKRGMVFFCVPDRRLRPFGAFFPFLFFVLWSRASVLVYLRTGGF